jgi:hypothetical protein
MEHKNPKIGTLKTLNRSPYLQLAKNQTASIFVT